MATSEELLKKPCRLEIFRPGDPDVDLSVIRERIYTFFGDNYTSRQEEIAEKLDEHPELEQEFDQITGELDNLRDARNALNNASRSWNIEK